jgi:hypothetical protein
LLALRSARKGVMATRVTDAIPEYCEKSAECVAAVSASAPT